MHFWKYQIGAHRHPIWVSGLPGQETRGEDQWSYTYPKLTCMELVISVVAGIKGESNNSLNYAQEVLNRNTNRSAHPSGKGISSPLVLVFLFLSGSHIEIQVILLLYIIYKIFKI